MSAINYGVIYLSDIEFICKILDYNMEKDTCTIKIGKSKYTKNISDIKRLNGRILPWEEN